MKSKCSDKDIRNYGLMFEKNICLAKLYRSDRLNVLSFNLRNKVRKESKISFFIKTFVTVENFIINVC